VTPLKIVNIEFVNVMPGGISSPHDRAVVLDTTVQEPHIITGQLQDKVVFRGTLADAHAFVKTQEAPLPRYPIINNLL
jgi:hypothetical protein